MLLGVVLSGQQREQSFLRAGDDVGRDDFSERGGGLSAASTGGHGGDIAKASKCHYLINPCSNYVGSARRAAFFEDTFFEDS